MVNLKKLKYNSPNKIHCFKVCSSMIFKYIHYVGQQSPLTNSRIFPLPTLYMLAVRPIPPFPTLWQPQIILFLWIYLFCTFYIDGMNHITWPFGLASFT